MHAIEMYTSSWCPFCVRAKALLDGKGLPYTEHVMDSDPAGLAEAKRRWGHPTVPIVIVDGELVGGCNELMALDRAGGLD
ncbi:MAG: glutaredoxin domain-containing protein [Planctomycetota bacterium]